MTIALRVHDIVKSFEGTPLLRQVSFEIARGEIVCLLGPSGSGKTTLLRIIAGLEEAESGSVFFDGIDVRGVPVHQRGFGLMFQDLALFPHQNVFENVAFGLRMQNATQDQIRTRVGETLDLVGLEGFAGRDVNNLSGGEQQRVALARSLAPRPKLLMLDEPLGALDRILREQLVGELRTILKRIDTLRATLYVTHDQDEAFALADRIAIAQAGRIEQLGAPEEIYRAPANAFVARFLGMPNLFPAHVLGDGRIETSIGIFRVDTPASNARIENSVALVRPVNIRIHSDGTGIPANVADCTFHAGVYRVRVLTDANIPLVLETRHALGVQAKIGLTFERIELLPA